MNVFSINHVEKNWISMQKKVNLDTSLTSHPTFNSRWITKAKTTELLEENIGEHLCDLGLDRSFLGHRKQ